jgi:hypothetical protein
MVKTLRRWRTAAFLATLACAAITGSSGIPVSADPTTMVLTGRGHTGYGPHAFVMNGSSVTGLYPGTVRNVGLRLVNPYGFDLRVETVRGLVVASSRRGCRPIAANLVARSYVGTLPVIVPAHGEKKAGSIPIHMPTKASAACEKTTFTIRLIGSATKARR